MQRAVVAASCDETPAASNKDVALSIAEPTVS
jgi:hypothetical protein